MALIELRDITKVFDGNMTALDNVSLDIKEHEFLTLLGPSGCGKTTMLRIIAGFEHPTSGALYLDGENVLDVPPHKRQVNTVFQNYALFPHLNVYNNIAFGLKLKKTPKEIIDRKVSDALNLVNLPGYQKRSIDKLSGGQQQRIAIARALVNEPKVLLLDEPLGALDLKLRKTMQLELKKMQQELKITFVYVTHDQEEALTMSDTVVVMNQGKILQAGNPTDIYNEPVNEFVADFIGESNIIDGVMKKDYLVNFDGVDFECVDKGFSPNENVSVVIRPEDIYIVDSEHGYIKGTVRSVVFKGVHYEMTIVDKSGYAWLIHDVNRFDEGQDVGMIIRPPEIHVMKKEATKIEP